jgi:hypothetical protein
MIEALLGLIALLLVGRMFQAHRQHKELIEWLDAYAEMVGEAIDKINNR